MSAVRTTAKKHSAPSASATAARLSGYLTVSIGAGVLGTSQADAEIVTINIGPTGFNIGGPNAGLSTGAYTNINNFPFSGGGMLGLLNQNIYIGYDEDVFTITGLYGYNGLLFAGGGGGAVTNFASGALIDASVTFSPDNGYGSSGAFYFRRNSLPPFVSPTFGPGSYVGFKTATGNYGWLEVTWNPSPQEFQIYSGAYESVAGVGIKAGDTGVVPEIDPNSFGSALSLVMGSLAVLEHRRRKRTESDSAAAVA